jgi:hypothetical protein
MSLCISFLILIDGVVMLSGNAMDFCLCDFFVPFQAPAVSSRDLLFKRELAGETIQLLHFAAILSGGALQ